jgi:inosine-uridine nucleoside N-ribohydrolase
LPDDIAAPQQLIDIVAEAKSLEKELTLVMIGPLTNLAQAIKLDPLFIKDIDRLVIMGGCGNARGNVHRTTEFNVVADAEAASIVFQNLILNNRLCTIISWELTMNATVPWKLFDELNNEKNATKSRLNDFLWKISAHSYATEKRASAEFSSGAVVCDAVALAVAICSTLEVCGYVSLCYNIL